MTAGGRIRPGIRFPAQLKQVLGHLVAVVLVILIAASRPPARVAGGHVGDHAPVADPHDHGAARNGHRDAVGLPAGGEGQTAELTPNGRTSVQRTSVERTSVQRTHVQGARQADGGIQWPAFTGIATPVTQLARGEARNTTAPAISEEWGRYPRAVSAALSA